MPASQLESANIKVCTGLPAITDDIYICARDVEMDGLGGILGLAKITAVDVMSGLPVAGYMEFDMSDLQPRLDAGGFDEVLLHEIGHLLGVGSLWEDFGLAANVGTSSSPQWVYSGANACVEWRRTTKCDGCPPIANEGGIGTVGYHWDESIMEHELMTASAGESGIPQPLSRITIASLADLGYSVNYDKADEYSVTSSVSCPNTRARRNAISRNKSTRHPNGTKERQVRQTQSKLSDEGRKAALEYGNKVLAEAKENKPETIPEGLLYTSDQYVNVVYQEQGDIFFVDVRSENAYR